MKKTALILIAVLVSVCLLMPAFAEPAPEAQEIVIEGTAGDTGDYTGDGGGEAEAPADTTGGGTDAAADPGAAGGGADAAADPGTAEGGADAAADPGVAEGGADIAADPGAAQEGTDPGEVFGDDTGDNADGAAQEGTDSGEVFGDDTGDNADGAAQEGADPGEVFGDDTGDNADGAAQEADGTGTGTDGADNSGETYEEWNEGYAAPYGWQYGGNEIAYDWTGENSQPAAGAVTEETAPAQEETQPMEEPDGSGIPKDEPLSTTGSTYGYDGVFVLDSASPEQVHLDEGEWDINDAQMLFWGGTVIENAGSSSLVVRNSYVRGETALPTQPLADDPASLLVAGNVRTTLATGNSETIFLNSTVVSRNWVALAADAAQPASAEGQKPLSLYAYGSEAITMDGGYGANADLFCHDYFYGSHVQAAEIGIISGTYGEVTIGTIADGEQDSALTAVLSQEDKDLQQDKELESIIEGGRNALMVHSENLPAYWEYEGCSQEELPLLSARITALGSTLRTNLSLDKGIAYDPQKQAYIDHTKGSVILIKSTNAEVMLNKCELLADPAGTGYLLQTVYNNDTQFMNAVPDGQNYPGIAMTMREMRLSGNIAHEDYQRDLNLTLSASALEGAVNEYDCAHWNQAAAEEGFTDYALDASYETHHGITLALQDGSVWTVTGESHLSKLVVGADCQVEGILYVDGTEQPMTPGAAWEGDVVLQPAAE